MLAIIFFALQVGSGAPIVRWLDPERRLPLLARFFAIPVVGLVVSGYVALVLALVTLSLPIALLATGLGMAIGLAAWWWKKYSEIPWASIWSAVSSAASRPATWGVVAIIGVAVALTIQVVFPASPYVQAVLAGWGDTALHLGMIERFAVSDPFALEHPILAGHPLTYPFFINFLSGMYRRLGAPTLVAFYLPTLTFLCCGLSLLYLFYRQLIARRKIALLCLFLALFGAGLGWIWFGLDAQAAYQRGGISALVETLRVPPHEYTHLDSRTGGLPAESVATHNIVWIVPVISFLTHQRSFSVGLAIAVIVLLGAAVYRGSGHLARFGVLAGLVPLAHGHTFIALAIIFFGLLLVQPGWWKGYLRFGLVTSMVALPSLLYLLTALRGSGGKSFFRWWWGWMTCTHVHHWFACDVPAEAGTDTSVLWFWTKNFGGVFWAWVVALIVAALFWGRRRGKVAGSAFSVALPSFLLFVAPNVARFQPWEFDNNKILFWWWIFALAVIGVAVAKIQRIRWRALTVAALAVVILPAGAVDITARLSRFTANHFPYVSNSEMEAAAWIRNNLPANARIAAAPIPNNFVPMLTGRVLALGYEGWLWTEGANSAPQRAALEALARGSVLPACTLGITHVVIDADFLSNFSVDETALAEVVIPAWQQQTPSGLRTVSRIACWPKTSSILSP